MCVRITRTFGPTPSPTPSTSQDPTRSDAAHPLAELAAPAILRFRLRRLLLMLNSVLNLGL